MPTLIQDPNDPRFLSQPGDLKLTLPPESKTAAGAATPPGTQYTPSAGGGTLDQLTALKLALKGASEVALKSGMRTNMNATFKGIPGFDPSKVSGNNFAKVIDFVESQTVHPIASALKDVGSVIDSISKRQDKMTSDAKGLKDDSRAQISQAISAGFWNTMPSAAKRKLWETAGYEGDPMNAKVTNPVGSRDVITISEYDSLNRLFKGVLPRSLIGMSQDDFQDQIKANKPPQWFVDSSNASAQTSLGAEQITNLWTRFKKDFTYTAAPVKGEEALY